MKASELLKGLQYSVICGDEDIEIKAVSYTHLTLPTT